MKLDTNFSKILHSDMKEYTRKFYAGEIKHPCDDECPDECDGDHNYPSIDDILEFHPLFKDNR